jgi:hypothetical protein
MVCNLPISNGIFIYVITVLSIPKIGTNPLKSGLHDSPIIRKQYAQSLGELVKYSKQ